MPSIRPAWPMVARPQWLQLLAELRWKARPAPHSRVVPAARSSRRGGRMRRRRPGGPDRPRIWRRSRAARRSSARTPRTAARCARLGDPECRIGQQLERGAALAVPVERNAVLCRLVRRDRQRIRRAPSPRRSAAILVSNCRCRSGPTQPSAMPLPVSRWSALSARSVSRYSAREVNIRYGSVMPRVTRSSIITPR